MTTRNRMIVALTAALTCAGPVAAQGLNRETETRLLVFIHAGDGHAAAFSEQADQREAAARARAQAERDREAIARAREQQRRALGQRGRARGQNIPDWPEVTEPFSRTVSLGPNGTFDLQNFVGDIIITGVRGNDARIEAVKRVRNPAEAQARALLQQLRIDVVERGGSVDVRTVQPRGPSTFAEVDYTVFLPNGANVAVRTTSGDVQVRNLNGELRAESNAGNVTATGVRRVRLVRTVSGNIELSDGEADELTASTMSGNLVVRNVRGRVFDLQSVTGLVRLANVAPDRVNLRSTNGDIEYLGRFVRNGRYEFLSHLGNIRVTPTSSQGFDIQASTFGGSFRSEYALEILNDIAQGRRGGSRVVRGTFGDAGAAITAHSFNGNIVIVKQP